MASTNNTSSRAFDGKQFKLLSHEEAEECGFISMLNPEYNGICLTKPTFPGVALYTTNPLSPQQHKGVGALVQIIPADDAIVYSEITAVQGREVTINMICTTKDTSTPVRFLLGNFFHDDTMFTITDGKNNLVELIIGGRSYTKLPGTTNGKEVLLADTGLKTSSEGNRASRPSSGTSYKITIARMTEDPKAFMSTFDNNNSIPLMSLKTPPPYPPPPFMQYPPPAYKKQVRFNNGYYQQRPAINGGYGGIGEMTAACSGLVTDGPGEEVADCAGPTTTLQRDCATPRRDCAGGGPADFAGEISSCASIVSNMSVESKEYRRRFFKPVSSYSVDVYFGKSLYTPPEPVVPPVHKAFVPKLTLCQGGRIFICPHGAHGLSDDLVGIVEMMDCPCVSDDARKYACIKMITNMLN